MQHNKKPNDSTYDTTEDNKMIMQQISIQDDKKRRMKNNKHKTTHKFVQNKKYHNYFHLQHSYNLELSCF